MRICFWSAVKTPFLISLSEIKKWSPKFFICCKGPLGVFEKKNIFFLKAAADNFLARFLIFSFGLWRPLGERKKKKIRLKLIIDQPPTEVYFTIFLIEATSEAPGTKLPTG